jgi:RHS repeat-associated protein
MNKYFLTFVRAVFCVLAMSVNAQNLNKPTLTPSPNAASLGKYGDIPVSYFTGTASPSVPIGSVDEGSLSMPVSLSYHTGGIKVTENASWCGLGWSLQAGGMMTRVVQGVADDNISKNGYYHSGSTLNFIYPNSDAQSIGTLKGDRDSEPDVFSVNFNGNSGKFYFDKDKICRFTEKRDWLVVPIVENFEFKGFVVTTEDGTRYHFGKVQGSTNTPLVERSGDFTNQQFSTTSWYLVRMESHDLKDAINLTYIAEDYEYKQPNYCREFLVISGCATGTNLVNQCNSSSKTTVIQQGWRLSSIANNSGTQTINFLANTIRQDLPVRLYYGTRASDYGGVTGEEAKRLDQIQIVSGTYTINHLLEYDYIYDGAAVSRTSDGTNARLRLLRVKKQKGAVDDQIYSFDYLNNLGTGKETFFPTVMSKQIDHWGYYNGATGNDNLGLLAPPTRVYNETGTYYKEAGLANRESNETNMKHGSLKRINFPTGGYTDFTMEANKHTALETTISSNLIFILNAGYGSSDCSTPLSAQSSWAPLTDPIASFSYKITFGNTYSLGTCSSSAPSGTLVFRDETTLATVATINLSTPTTGTPSPLSTIFNFDPTKRYRVTINISNANLCVFELTKTVSTTQPVTRAVGGLRVQQVTNYDHVTQVSNSKTYTYVDAEGSTKSSGFLFNVPKYGHYISTQDLTGVMFWSGSVTPMSNYQGYHIGYKRVEEKVVGSIGKTVYEFKAEKEFNNPGESYSSSNESYPLLPRMPNFSNGQISTSTQLDQAGSSVASSTYNGVAFGQPIIGEVFYKIYYLGELIPPIAPLAIQTCINEGNVQLTDLPRLYKVSIYTGTVGSYRLQSKTEVLDNVSTTTTYKYDGSNRHLMSKGTRVTNSEGKEYETTIKYVHDYVGGELATTSPTNQTLITADLVTTLKSRNIISLPIETISTVKTGTTTITTGGQRMQFSFFDPATGVLPTTTVLTHPIYIYKSYAYETPHDNTTYADSKWQLKATITKYNMTLGKPELYLSDGWGVSEKYTYNATNRLVSKKEFLGTTTGLTWEYLYEANTKLLSKYIDENGLIKTFTYDPLMRLQTLKDRMKTDGTAVQTTTTYDYYYYKATSPTIPSYVSMSTSFVNATNTTPLSSKQYVDGLGRPLSTVRETYTPALLHQKNNTTYDALGRKDKTFLPFESGSLGYEAAGVVPFGFATYEQSPLSRPIKQTNVDFTGITINYGANAAIDSVRKFTFTSVVSASGTVVFNSFYALNELSKVSTWDENGTFILPTTTTIGKMEVYKDRLGRTILTRRFLGTQKVDTYNVYDDFGSLVMVIPPGALDASGNPIASLVFTYTYDNRNRLIEKKVPSAEPQKFFYDERDLLTLTQDGNMRTPASGGNANKYLATEYNNIGQVVKTGWVSTTTPLTFANSGFLIPNDTNKLTEIQYYPGRTWVKNQGAKVIKPKGVSTVREFVWSYIERRPGLEYTGNPVWTAKQHLLSQTYLNGTTPMPDLPINDYDYGGVDWTVSAYDGAQKPTITISYLFSGPNTTHAQEVRQWQTFNYDNGQRLTSSNYTSGLFGAQVASPTFTLSNMVYNHKDQLIEKNTAFVNNKYLQSTDFAYNNRGWLTSINSGFQPSSLDYPLFTTTNNAGAYYENLPFQFPTPNSGEHNADLFKETIQYDAPNTAFPNSGSAQRNGNISQIEWQVAGREAQGYSFKYDDLDRLTEANYTDNHGSNWAAHTWPAQYETDNKFQETATYDLRGNIQNLTRKGQAASIMGFYGNIVGSFSATDNLTYTYNPSDLNKLNKVTDAANTSKGFKTVTNNSLYTYDTNGNLTSDMNKNITEITYNYLNLPLVITFTYNASGQPRRIEFIYDATGAKLRKTVFENNVAIETRDYVNGKEYKGGILDRFAMTEGAVVRQADNSFVTEYTLKDHLGNARVTYSDANNDGTIGVSDIKQINHYYPFGMNMDGNWNIGGGTNKYQYNSKEFNSDFGLNWNDYGARFYDAAVCRWIEVEPLAEQFYEWTPYNYALNNPSIYVDPDGRNPLLFGAIGAAGGLIYGLATGKSWQETAALTVGGFVGGASGAWLYSAATLAFGGTAVMGGSASMQTLIYSGMFGGLIGEAAEQGTEMALGARTKLDGQGIAVSGTFGIIESLIGGAIEGVVDGVKGEIKKMSRAEMRRTEKGAVKNLSEQIRRESAETLTRSESKTAAKQIIKIAQKAKTATVKASIEKTKDGLKITASAATASSSEAGQDAVKK